MSETALMYETLGYWVLAANLPKALYTKDEQVYIQNTFKLSDANHGPNLVLIAYNL